MSSGVVSSLTKITLSPLPPLPSLLASSAVNTILPAAAPGDAGSAEPITSPSFNALTSNVGCNN